MTLNPTIEAYVIADYLMTAGIRLRITDPAVFDATRRALQRYPESPETGAALAFLDALERAGDESWNDVDAEIARRKW